MIVTAVRKGFYKKLREVGDRFNIDVEECPSWCEEDGAGNPKKSSEFTSAREASTYIMTIDDEDKIMEFIDGDERKTIMKSASDRIKELNEVE